ncbi:uncharacterized protein EI90DRAFT_3075246 [Cantharellus anzutake]|uniref:uncharacterized protein n=1 Tax=Cantharellus anzutake TaxID=1750568 RepID=UPI0019045C89|nr:uncharacterized protein EI90DRAFT_3075246 [Cantharellus anzutake]KAF8324624.1 hypothetical protein EI90DRAFT_3075246 [Cantharellus anzutake]
MRRQLIDMGYLSTSKPGDLDATHRERVLVDMVLRLLRARSGLHTSQLIRQAEVISELSTYTDVINQQHAQERERWEAERFASHRLMDAMFIRMQKEGVSKLEELERENRSIFSENRVLRKRLRDTQTRLDQLEAELHALRPFFLYTSCEASGRPIQTSLLSSPSPRTAKPRSETFTHRDVAGEEPTADILSQKQTSRYGRPELPILGDARSEHMLLVARKLGRERVARIALPLQCPSASANVDQGMLFPASPYPLHRLVSPQTPTGPRISAIFGSVQSITPLCSSLLSPTIIPPTSRNQLPRPNAAANAAAAAAAVVVGASGAPGASPQKQKTASTFGISPCKKTPSTPVHNHRSLDATPSTSGLDNLFMAAKRVLDHDDDEPQLSTPTKRRRIETESRAKPGAPVTTPNSPVETAMSALQVLAQQAVTLGSSDRGGYDSSDPPDVVVVENGRGAAKGQWSPDPPSPRLPVDEVSQTSKPATYLKYAPDYKSRPSRGLLPPPPDYSAAFGGTKAKAKSTPLGKSAPLPLLPRTPTIINPYSPGVLNLAHSQYAVRATPSPSHPTSASQTHALSLRGHVTFSSPLSATRCAVKERVG